MTSAEIEQADRRPVNLGVPLNGLDEAFRLAKNLAIATIIPDDLRGKPSDVLAIVLYGQELGMAPMQSLQGIYVVKGKPQLASQTWIALARRAGHKVRIVDSTNESCTVTITRADDPDNPHTETFTIHDAAAAGLCELQPGGKVRARTKSGQPTPWESYTKSMLRNRAISNAGKFACPEVAMGFAIEGDYDYVPDDQSVEVAAPEHHGPSPLGVAMGIEDAEIVPEEVAAEVAEIAAEFEQTTLDGGE